MKSIYSRRGEITSITWFEFITSFNDQYFLDPIIWHKALALELNNLNQGNNSIMEYAKKILQLERLSLGSMENEKATCNKFL